MSNGWDAATVKKLKTLAERGLSTSEIGKHLGMSKNAVVGKLNRLKWNAKANAKNSKTVVDKKPKTSTTGKKSVVKMAVEVIKSKMDKKPKNTKTESKTKKTVSKATDKKKTVFLPKAKRVSNDTVKKNTLKESKPQVEKKSVKDLADHQRIIQHSLELASLKPNQCRWPIGDPDSDNFHFCGKTVFTGKPYCLEHCKQAYQFTQPKKK